MCKCSITSVILDNNSSALNFINNRYNEKYINDMLKNGGALYFTTPSRKVTEFVEKGKFADLKTPFFDDKCCYFCNGQEYDVMLNKDGKIFHKTLFDFNVPQKNFTTIYPKGKICDECLYMMKLYIDEEAKEMHNINFLSCSDCGDEFIVDPEHCSNALYHKESIICDDCLRTSLTETYYSQDTASIILGDPYQKTIVCSSCFNIQSFDYTNPKEFDLILKIDSGHHEYYCPTCLSGQDEFNSEIDDELPFGDKPKEVTIPPLKKAVDLFLTFKPDVDWHIHLKSYYAQNDWWLTFSIITLKASSYGSIRIKNEDLDIEEVIFNGIKTVKVQYKDNNSITDILEHAYETARLLKNEQNEATLEFDSFIYD